MASLLLVTDTETSGNDALGEEVISYKLPAHHEHQPRMASVTCILKDSETLKTYGTYFAYVKPNGWKMTKGATDANGLTDEFLAQAGVPIDGVMGTIADWMAKGVILVCHNTAFDHKILRGEFRRCNLPDFYEQTPTFCTMRSNQKEMGVGSWPSLAATYEYYMGKPLQGAHGSFNDALAVVNIYSEMRRRGIPTTPKPPKSGDAPTSAPRPQKKGAEPEKSIADLSTEDAWKL